MHVCSPSQVQALLNVALDIKARIESVTHAQQLQQLQQQLLNAQQQLQTPKLQQQQLQPPPQPPPQQRQVQLQLQPPSAWGPPRAGGDESSLHGDSRGGRDGSSGRGGGDERMRSEDEEDASLDDFQSSREQQVWGVTLDLCVGDLRQPKLSDCAEGVVQLNAQHRDLDYTPTCARIHRNKTFSTQYKLYHHPCM